MRKISSVSDSIVDLKNISCCVNLKISIPSGLQNQTISTNSTNQKENQNGELFNTAFGPVYSKSFLSTHLMNHGK